MPIFNSVNFLGKGFALDFKEDPATGDIIGVSEEENIKDSIRNFLSTIQGERVLLESYGLPRLPFENFEAGTADVLRQATFEGLSKYEPRVRIVDITVKKQTAGNMTGILYYLKYRIRSNNMEDSLVYFEGDE